jgi:protein tyrosine/serine phosphatase
MAHPTMERHLNWPDLHNARDLGGLPTRDGRAIRRGAFVRADGLHNLNVTGFHALREYGIGLVIDLRSSKELASLPNPLRVRPEIKFAHISLLGKPGDYVYDRDSGLAPHSEWALLLLEHSQPRFLEVLRAIAWQPRDQGVLFHCHAGKDRTGLIADLLLDLADVPDESIIADYLLTNERNRELRENGLAAIADIERREDARNRWMVFESTVRDVLAHLRARYGGARGYMRAIGLSDAEINAIAARMF